MQELKKNFNVKKVSQIETIIKDAESRVRKVKNIPKNKPTSGKENDFFLQISKKFIDF